MKTSEEHKHDFKKYEEKISLYSSKVHPNGSVERSYIVGKDILKQFRCSCGKTIAYDVIRVEDETNHRN